MSTVGNVNIRITADNASAERGIKQTKGSVSSLGKSVGKNAVTWAKWGAAAGAAALAVAAALTKAAMSTVDELAKTARSMDASIAGLQGLQLAAREAGVSKEAAASSAQMLNQRLGEAARGTGEAAAQLDRLGLNAAELQRMDVDQRFAAIAQRTRELGFNSAQTADALRNLGIRNREMVLLMQQGGEDILNATNRVQDYGLSLDEVDAAKVEQANDTFAFAADIIRNVFQRAAIEVAPIIQAIGERFLGSAQEAGGLGDMVGKVFDFLIEMIAKATTAIDAIIRSIRTIGNAFDMVISGIVGAWAAMWRTIMRAVDSGIKGVVDGVNVLIRQLNRIPRVDIDEIAHPELAAKAAEFFDTVGGAAVERMEDAWDRTQEVWSKPYAGDTVRSFVAESRDMADIAAREAVAARDAVFDEAGPPPSFMFSEDENQKWLEQLRQRFMDENELWQEKHQADLDRLKEARDQELLTEQEYQERLTLLTREAADRRAKIAEEERQARVATLQSMLGNMTGLMNTGSRKMFEIGKAAAVANALVQGREAVVSSYAAGARIGGPPVGAAFAATAAAATASQIAQVRQSSFSSGGAASAGTFDQGLGAIRTAQAGGSGPAQTFTINLAGSGQNFTADDIDGLIRQINQRTSDGVVLRTNRG